MPLGDPALVTRGYASCPDCYARLVGYADVTLHPTIRVGNGSITLGKHVDAPAQIAKGVKDATPLALADELYCSRPCGYRIHATQLLKQVRGEDSG